VQLPKLDSDAQAARPASRPPGNTSDDVSAVAQAGFCCDDLTLVYSFVYEILNHTFFELT
jgi:hypothetical protein